jgi:hypothetical protein
MRYPCPCCGYLTLESEPPGTFEICPVCYWKDDNIQFGEPDFQVGANKVSLNQAKFNFAKIGVSDAQFISQVRKPYPNECP